MSPEHIVGDPVKDMQEANLKTQNTLTYPQSPTPPEAEAGSNTGPTALPQQSEM